MMQGEVIPRGARYSIIITTQYASSRNTLRPSGRSREDRGVRYRGSILQAVRNKPRLLHLALTYSCPSSEIAPPASGTLQIYSWPTTCPCTPTLHFCRAQSAIQSPSPFFSCKAVRLKLHQGLGMTSSNKEQVLLPDRVPITLTLPVHHSAISAARLGGRKQVTSQGGEVETLEGDYLCCGCDT